MTIKPCVLIPAYNESKTIGPLVSAIRAKNLDVVVVDDGSHDQTGTIARQAGAHVIYHDEKKGKGQSLRDGFDYILRKDYDGVITMDGDGQHAVEDLDLFLTKAREHDGIITGTRMQNTRNMPWLRRLTNKFMSALISFVCHQPVPDTQCGYRFLGREILKTLTLSCSDFEIETEVLIEASRKGFKISSVPVKTIYQDENSKINPFTDTIRFIVYIIKAVCSPRSS